MWSCRSWLPSIQQWDEICGVFLSPCINLLENISPSLRSTFSVKAGFVKHLGNVIQWVWNHTSLHTSLLVRVSAQRRMSAVSLWPRRGGFWNKTAFFTALMVLHNRGVDISISMEGSESKDVPIERVPSCEDTQITFISQHIVYSAQQTCLTGGKKDLSGNV